MPTERTETQNGNGEKSGGVKVGVFVAVAHSVQVGKASWNRGAAGTDKVNPLRLSSLRRTPALTSAGRTFNGRASSFRNLCSRRGGAVSRVEGVSKAAWPRKHTAALATDR